MSIASHSLSLLTWEGFLENMEKRGFETGFHKSEENGLEERIFFNPQNGIIIYSFTYSGKYANHAIAYGELKIKGNDKEKDTVMSMFKHFRIANGVIAFSLDAKEKLEKLTQRRVQFVTPWKIKQEMQLTNLAERQNLSPREQDKVIQRKIKECSREMKKIIGFR